MSRLATVLLTVALLAFVSCEVNDHGNFRLSYNHIQDTNPLFLNESYYAGFQPIQQKGSLFFWLFESRGHKDTDPLVIWLTGGPGCSSELALLVENGPYYVNKENNTLRINPYSWNNNANLLYIDQPLGTGFSTGTQLDKTEDEIAADFYLFLQEFLDSFPQFKGRDFYITGESYAGHYIPAISNNIVKQGGLDLKFNGIAIGNGLMSVYWQYPKYADYALENNLVDEKLYKSLVTGFKLCDSLIKQGLYSLALVQCQTQVERILGNPPKFNVYDIREPCEHQPLCYDLSFVDDFLEQPAVQTALGVSGRPWSECNNTVHTELSADWITDFTATLGTLINSGLRVLIYHGDKDFICNWRGGETLTENIPWAGQDEFNKQNYTVYENFGEYKHLDNLTFYRVYNAGHMVPMDQPLAALNMLDKFIAGWN